MITVIRDSDGCYYVAKGKWRGPKKHSATLAIARYRARGLQWLR